MTGLYQIENFIASSTAGTYGSVTIRTSDSSDIKVVQLLSGTVDIVDEGANRFDVEIDAVLAQDEGSITMKINHQF